MELSRNAGQFEELPNAEVRDVEGGRISVSDWIASWIIQSMIMVV